MKKCVESNLKASTLSLTCWLPWIDCLRKLTHLFASIVFSEYRSRIHVFEVAPLADGPPRVIRVHDAGRALLERAHQVLFWPWGHGSARPKLRATTRPLFWWVWSRGGRLQTISLPRRHFERIARLHVARARVGGARGHHARSRAAARRRWNWCIRFVRHGACNFSPKRGCELKAFGSVVMRGERRRSC